MITKILAIAYNGLYRAYNDQTALIFMFAAPLAISTIMGLVFGGGDEVNLPDSNLIVVNLDDGTESALNGGDMPNALGDIYVGVLVDDTPTQLADLLTGNLGDDPEAAREAVETGDATAALIIPPSFSADVSAEEQVGTVELYYNAGENIGSTVVIAVVQDITTRLNNGEAAQDIFLNDDEAYFLSFIPDLQSDANYAITQAANDSLNAIYGGETTNLVSIQSVNITGEEDPNLLSYFAPAMAILFMTFAMASGTRDILKEQREWTMQRIISTPTPRWVYLAGRLVGSMTTGILQMLILLVATVLVSVLTGGDADIWGTNVLGLGVMTVLVVWAGTGLGLLIASVSNTVEQADTISTFVLFLLAMLGGSFVPVDGIEILDIPSRLTLNFWGIDGYFSLANENASLGDLGQHIGALALMGGAFFLFALWRFNRRLSF